MLLNGVKTGKNLINFSYTFPLYHSYNRNNKLNLLILIYKMLYKKENINLIII